MKIETVYSRFHQVPTYVEMVRLSGMSTVGLVKVRGHGFVEAITKSLQMINYDFPLDVQNVVIKPNMCYYWDHSTGETTDPEFVAGLITVLRQQISPQLCISIVESDASAMKCKYAFRMLGYEEMARKLGVSLVNLSDEKSKRATVDVGDCSFSFRVPQTIRNADFKINVPKIKYHSLKSIKMTCALKNIFGCNPYPRKSVYHSRIEEVIVALNKIMRFDLCIVDGNVVVGGQTQRLGLAMASRDPVAIDSLAACIAGIDPESVRYLLLASREGLGHLNFIWKGTDWKYFRDRYPRVDAKKRIRDIAFDIIIKLGLEARLGLD